MQFKLLVTFFTYYVLDQEVPVWRQVPLEHTVLQICTLFEVFKIQQFF